VNDYLSLTGIAGLESSVLSRLQRTGITHAEDICGYMASPSLRSRFLRKSGLSTKDVEGVLKGTGLSPTDFLVPNLEAVIRELGLGARKPTRATQRRIRRLEREYFRGASSASSFPRTPASANLIPMLPPIQNQGQRGTCVAFGTAAVRESLIRGAPKLSEQFLYWTAKERDGLTRSDGTWIHCAMAGLSEVGVCRAHLWPYDRRPRRPRHHGPPPSAAVADAAAFRIGIPIPITTDLPENFKRILSGKSGLAPRAIAFSIPVFDSWLQNPVTYKRGKFPMPLPRERANSGHCMAIVGYQDDSRYAGGGYFIVRNSWGTQWASESPHGPGHGMIPYAFIERHCQDAFTATGPGETRTLGIKWRGVFAHIGDSLAAVGRGVRGLGFIGLIGLVVLYFLNPILFFEVLQVLRGVVRWVLTRTGLGT
jgi:hypothetical protein